MTQKYTNLDRKLLEEMVSYILHVSSNVDDMFQLVYRDSECPVLCKAHGRCLGPLKVPLKPKPSKC